MASASDWRCSTRTSLPATEHRHEDPAQGPLEGLGADPFQPLVDRLVPGGGEAVGTLGVEQLVGASPGHADGAGGTGDAAATRQGEDEGALPRLRPAAAAGAAARHGVERDVLGRVVERGFVLGPVEGRQAHPPAYAGDWWL